MLMFPFRIRWIRLGPSQGFETLYQNNPAIKLIVPGIPPDLSRYHPPLKPDMTDLIASQAQPFGKDTAIQTPRRFLPIMHDSIQSADF